MQKALEKNGAYRVSVFATGQAALEQLARQRYVVAVVDFGVQDISGPELVLKLRETQPGLRVVAVHAPDTPLPAEVKVDSALTRPYRARDLVALLLKQTDKKKDRRRSSKNSLSFDDLFESGVGLEEQTDTGELPQRRGSPTRKFGTEELSEESRPPQSREPEPPPPPADEDEPEHQAAERGQRPLYEIVMGEGEEQETGDSDFEPLEGDAADKPAPEALPDDMAYIDIVGEAGEIELEDTDELPDWLAKEKPLVDELTGHAEPEPAPQQEEPQEPEKEPSLLAGTDLPDWLAEELPNVPSTDELRGEPTETEAGRKEHSPEEEANIAQLALQLTHLAGRSPAEVMLLTQNRQLLGYAGAVQEADALDLAAAVYRHWDPEGASSQTQAQFVRLRSMAKDYILYSVPTAGDKVLSMAFPANMPLRQVRRQARELERALQREEPLVSDMSVEKFEMPEPETEVELTAAEPPVEEAAPAEAPVPRTSYACVWTLRDIETELNDAQKQHLERWLAEIAGMHGWRVQAVEFSAGYIKLHLDVPTTNAPAQIVEMLMDSLSNRMLAAYAGDFSAPPGAGIWAAGYYLVTPARDLSEREINRFIDFQRREQSVPR